MAIGTRERHCGDGAVLALVTWIERDDPHWFGGRIPEKLEAVEFVKFSAAETTSYSHYDGAGQLRDHAGTGIALQRTNFVLGLAPARLP